MIEEIEWLNSLDIPSCALVTSAEDLVSGVVLCDLAAFLKSRPLFEEVSRHGTVQKNFRRAAANNFKLFLREIGNKLPSGLVKRPEEMSEDKENLVKIVGVLRKMSEKPQISVKNVEIRPKLTRNMTPKGRMMVSPASHRLQHSPSMLDIRNNTSVVSDDIKENISKWLFELKIINSDPIEEIKDGYALCELINRLEGKCEVIKGAQKAPKTRSAVQVNINKALSYLRTVEKMNSKYLWSMTEILEGDEESIFGLLGSIQEYYTSKRISSRIGNKSPKILNTRVFSALQLEEHEPEYSEIKNLLKNMGFAKLLNGEKSHFLDDPARNGMLLYEVILRFEGVEISGITVPKSLSAAQHNLSRCLSFVYDKYPALGSKYLRTVENIINGDGTIWLLLEELINQPRNTEKKASELPYSSEQLTKLQKAISDWISVVSGKCFENFEIIVHEISSGVLLSELVQNCGIPLTGIMKQPRTEKVRQGNIEKALDVLRKNARMSQKFLWQVKEIAEGKFSVILGLLEDLFRFYEGLPARKRGPNYHSDGPFLGKRMRKDDVSPLRITTTALNKSFESITGYNTTRKHKEDIVPRGKDLISDELFTFSASEFEWVYNLGIGIGQIDFNAEEIEEFKSGVLLCQMVEKLERVVLSGVEGRPKSNAVALYNIGKAMKLLRNKPMFPSTLMFIEEEIARGKGEAVRSLLRAMQKVYKQTIRTHLKFSTVERANYGILV
jgi:hypothetical protein